MAYSKQNFKDGATLYAHQLNYMEDGIENASNIADNSVSNTVFETSQQRQDSNISVNSTKITELQSQKADKVEVHSFTIQTTGWAMDTAVSGFANYYDISVDGMTDNDVVNVMVAPVSSRIAVRAQFTNTESFNGYFRLRAKNIPESEISAQWYIVR